MPQLAQVAPDRIVREAVGVVAVTPAEGKVTKDCKER